MAYDIFHNYNFETGKMMVENYFDDPNPDWALVSCKSVEDSDGFITDYCWYTDGDKHIFMFGDSDLYEPNEDYADWVCETEEEAKEWFDNYEGFKEVELEYYDEAFINPTRNFINKGFDRVYKSTLFNSPNKDKEEDRGINLSIKSLHK